MKMPGREAPVETGHFADPAVEPHVVFLVIARFKREVKEREELLVGSNSLSLNPATLFL
jgi:hypothetical protein